MPKPSALKGLEKFQAAVVDDRMPEMERLLKLVFDGKGKLVYPSRLKF